jgi:hypothetical protein
MSFGLELIGLVLAKAPTACFVDAIDKEFYFGENSVYSLPDT